MELREIQYILRIAELGSISKAAQHLYVAQSSLSQFLKNYEAKCGYALFLRTPQGLKPTREGELFLRTARQIERLQHNLNNQLLEMSQLNRGKVVFSLSSFRSPFLLPLVMPPFRRQYPNIEVSTIEAHMKKQERLLEDGSVDVAFLCLPLLNKDIPYLKVLQEEIFLAAPKDHPIARKANYNPSTGHQWLDFSAMNGQEFLLYSVNHRLSQFSDLLFEKHEITPRIVQTHESFQTLILLTEAGMGLTFIPETYIDPQQNLSYFSIGPSGQYRTLVLGYPPSGYHSKAAQVFSDLIVEKLQERHRIITMHLNKMWSCGS